MTKKEGVEWCGVGVCFGGTNIEEIGGSAKCFDPEFRWHGGVNEESADNIIERAERAFCFAILGRCVGTGKTQEDAVLEEEIAVLKVIKFFTVVTLDESNWEKEVGGYITLKIKKNCVDVGFVAERKSPSKVGEII